MRRRTALFALALLAPAAVARAQSFVDRLHEDPCVEARSFAIGDQSREAQHVRRACRLQVLSQRLAAERRERTLATDRQHAVAVQYWVDLHYPSRASHPFGVDLFLGSGLASYGAAASWLPVTPIELGLWVGGRGVSWNDNVSNRGSLSYARQSYGLFARWLMVEKDFTPFVGVGFAITTAQLRGRIYAADYSSIEEMVGTGRGHAVTASAGLQMSRGWFRGSVEYVFSYAFYTQANKNDEAMTQDQGLWKTWQDSLDRDMHGMRVQVGYAF